MPIGRVEKQMGKMVTVSINRRDMCGDCHGCDVVKEVKTSTIQCINECGASLGDIVEVDITNTSFLQATVIMYGIPLVALIGGVLLGVMLPIEAGLLHDLCAIILGLGCMTLAFLIVKKRDKNSKYERLLPRAVKICSGFTETVCCGQK